MKSAKKSVASKVGKPWREFEKLVSRIEEFLCPKGAVVESPAYIPDLETGTMREVDASIRFTVGSTQLLIVIECRDRSQKQDVLWIEQLSSKKRNLGISELIAVSSIGFTPEAVRKGRSLGVQIRKLNKISNEDILDFLTLNVEYQGWRTKNCTIHFANDVGNLYNDFIAAEISKNGPLAIRNEKLLFSESSEDVISTSDVFDYYYNQAKNNNEFENVAIPENGESPLMTLDITLPENNFYFLHNETKLYVKSMSVEFVHYDRRLSMKSDEQFEYHDAQSNEKLVDLHEFKDSDEKSFFSKYTFKQHLKTDKYSVIGTKVDGTEVDISGGETEM